jgi:Nucleotide modification associated domain 2
MLHAKKDNRQIEPNIINMENIRLFSYKMTHDTGFAPNPFHGLLTLANCKPCIRKYKIKDDWIAGFTSQELNGDNVGEEKLVYLMKVIDKITYNEYWNNPLYKLKKPNLSSSKTIDKTGDNIYKPIKVNPKSNTDFKQVPNKNHNDEDKDHDLNGKFVLVSKCFYYFGSSPIKINNKI